MATTDSNIKVIIVGDSGVGKTSLQHQFTGTEFYSQELQPTKGIDLSMQIIQIDNKRVKLQLWDSVTPFH